MEVIRMANCLKQKRVVRFYTTRGIWAPYYLVECEGGTEVLSYLIIDKRLIEEYEERCRREIEIERERERERG